MQNTTPEKTTVIYHSADFDGIFCREIAKKFMPHAELIGWDFKDKPLPFPDGKVYVLDLPVDRVFGFSFMPEQVGSESVKAMVAASYGNLIWIDHHKSSIESHPDDIPGYRIDGVAACRLAWHWFSCQPAWTTPEALASKQDFIDRIVSEPVAVRLAGEYDVWDKRDPDAEVFQFGLRSRELTPEIWDCLLSDATAEDLLIYGMLRDGRMLQSYQQRNDAGMMHRSFVFQFEGLKFLALTTARCNSLTFASKDVPETGHDALMGFYFDGQKWIVSMYHAKHNTGIDLSAIAVKHGGGGHRGACGFSCATIPFL